MIAARNNELVTVKEILKTGIDPTNTKHSILNLNKTPLLAAIEGRAYKTALYLWKNYDFDPNFKNCYQDSPLSVLKKRLASPALENKERKQIQGLIKAMSEEKAEPSKCLVC